MFFPFPVLASFGTPHRVVPIVEERGEVGIGFDEDAASSSTVTSIRPALGHELLTNGRS